MNDEEDKLQMQEKKKKDSNSLCLSWKLGVCAFQQMKGSLSQEPTQNTAEDQSVTVTVEISP